MICIAHFTNYLTKNRWDCHNKFNSKASTNFTKISTFSTFNKNFVRKSKPNLKEDVQVNRAIHCSMNTILREQYNSLDFSQTMTYDRILNLKQY